MRRILDWLAVVYVVVVIIGLLAVLAYYIPATTALLGAVVVFGLAFHRAMGLVCQWIDRWEDQDEIQNRH